MNYPLGRLVGVLTGLVLAGAALLRAAAPAPDLGKWSLEGAVELDASRPGPDGAPAIKVAPGAKAVLKLRDADGTGTVTFHVYDDGVVGSPGKVKAIGPRWGVRQADGRVLIGALIYARYLHADGSLCLIDTVPEDRGAWNTINFVSPRKAGWNKWEFRYDPDAGVTVRLNDQPIPAKYFDWNKTKATGFSSIVLFGDESSAGGAFYVAGIEYELGGPMKVRPDPEVAVRAAREAALAKEAANKKPAKPAAPREKWTGGFPGPTLADDLDLPQTPLVAGYAEAPRPRLLFSADQREALKRKAEKHPELWAPVIANAKRVISPASVPAPQVVMDGKTYWRIEYIYSAALAWFVTGDERYKDGAIRWMVAHCREPVWGTAYRPNLDLQASWYLYYLSLSYDLLHGEINEADRAVIRDGLALHSKALFDDFDPIGRTEKIRYEQNHTYTPIVALIAGSLVLLGEEPDAAAWLERARAVLRRSRYVLGDDGYYYEGFGYWTYSLHWHVRGAELLGRATGENPFDIPVLRDTWRYALHLSLPGKPWAYDIGDTGHWKADQQRPDIRVNHAGMLWAIATAMGSRESRAAGDLIAGRSPEREYPASPFLWFDEADEPRPLEEIPPYHYFKDHGIVTWRSGWDADATTYFFRSGPPLGHAAAAKLAHFKDWTPNAGHVHADIGGFLLYAKGAYLAVDTGYTAEKWTRDQNTLLIDGQGQAMDGAYHNERGIPYAQLDAAKIEKAYLSKEYGFAVGEFGSAYTRQVKNAEMRRSLLMTKRWMLAVDDLRMKDDSARRLTWICHADAPFVAEAADSGAVHVARLPDAGLAVLSLTPAADALEAKTEETVVMYGMAPGRGQPAKRGYHMSLTSREPAAKMRFVNLLVPLSSGEKPPVVEKASVADATGPVSFTLRWADGRIETVKLDLNWSESAGGKGGPAEIVTQ
jgi:hypothetical protein